jgi:predicted metalloprotease
MRKTDTMRWDRNHRSDDVLDQRGEGGGGPSAAGVGILFWLMSRFGLPGLLVGGAILAVGYFMSPSAPEERQAVPPGGQPAASAQRDETADFVGFVLDDVQTTWKQIFTQSGKTYKPAKLVMFTGETRSGCGYGSAEVGPFYCPTDARVYIDLAFYQDLERRLGAGGDFAQAYVIAHEVGHHVQNLLGIRAEAQKLSRGGAPENEISIRQELQADCFAGVWAHSTKGRNTLEPGDVEEGLRAAAAIGDDKLQERAEGRVRPERWTHGSSAQRVSWFQRGYKTGTIDGCDTLNTSNP